MPWRGEERPWRSRPHPLHGEAALWLSDTAVQSSTFTRASGHAFPRPGLPWGLHRERGRGWGVAGAWGMGHRSACVPESLSASATVLSLL